MKYSFFNSFIMKSIFLLKNIATQYLEDSFRNPSSLVFTLNSLHKLTGSHSACLVVLTPFRLGGESLMVCPRGGGGGASLSRLLSTVLCHDGCISVADLPDRPRPGRHTHEDSVFLWSRFPLPLFPDRDHLRGSWNSLSFVKYDTGLRN